MSGSLHGFAHLFDRRSFRAKQGWSLAILLSAVIFFFCTIQTFVQHFIQIPVQIHIHYIRKDSLLFPDVLFCPTMADQRIAEGINDARAPGAFSQLSFASTNPLFKDFKHHLKTPDFSKAFTKYPQMEVLWARFTSNLNETSRKELGLYIYIIADKL